MDDTVLNAMKAAGLSPEVIAMIRSQMRRRVRIPLGAQACPGCGGKAARYDYVCGGCGKVKAEYERLFWQYVFEREQGTGSGRPKQQKALPQRLPRQTQYEAPPIRIRDAGCSGVIVDSGTDLVKGEKPDERDPMAAHPADQSQGRDLCGAR